MSKVLYISGNTKFGCLAVHRIWLFWSCKDHGFEVLGKYAAGSNAWAVWDMNYGLLPNIWATIWWFMNLDVVLKICTGPCMKYGLPGQYMS